MKTKAMAFKGLKRVRIKMVIENQIMKQVHEFQYLSLFGK
jgi:hypothetical protein